MECLPHWLQESRDRDLVVALVRHGRTAWNAERRMLGITDVPLDERGIRQAERLGACLGGRFDRVYSSPLSRAVETARRLSAEVQLLPELGELDQGELEGLSVEEAIRNFAGFFERWREDPGGAAPPGGETLAACRDRAFEGLGAIAARHGRGEAVAVVTHQMVIASITCTVAGSPLAEWHRHAVRNAAVSVLLRGRESWAIAVEDWRPERHDSGTGPNASDV